jgi:hypothetical protein
LPDRREALFLCAVVLREDALCSTGKYCHAGLKHDMLHVTDAYWRGSTRYLAM